jgi:xanthine dehydrogenase accessory factor
LNFWKELHGLIRQNKKVAVLLVLESTGSSPGRQGFKMAVTDSGEMIGSIGGGIMEQKLVELAKSHLESGRFQPFIKKQIHRSDAEKDRSGMICSGEQTVSFYFLNEDDQPLLETIKNRSSAISILANESGLKVEAGNSESKQFQFSQTDENRWEFREQLDVQDTAYIFGGGHVGLAMSRMMSQLDFKVVVFDDRDGLNTLQKNEFADEIHIIDYNHSDQYVPEGEHSYVIIMSFGYKPDEVIIRRLLGKKFKYIGLMGSQHKIETMWKSLQKDGFSEADLNRVHSPIGIPIHSKTPVEIAVSIAAEIIRVKNE